MVYKEFHVQVRIIVHCTRVIRGILLTLECWVIHTDGALPTTHCRLADWLGRPNGLDDETPPPCPRASSTVKLLLAEPSGGDVKVKVQGLQDQNRMMGALAENDEVCACACAGGGGGEGGCWVLTWGAWICQSNLKHQ